MSISKEETISKTGTKKKEELATRAEESLAVKIGQVKQFDDVFTNKIKTTTNV